MTYPNAVAHEIGAKDDFSKARAREMATGFCLAITAYPDVPHMLCVGGYDDDTRELWDIPEARAFVRDFAGWVALIMPGVPLRAWKLDEASLALILMCTGFGRITGRNPENGNWLIESGEHNQRSAESHG